MLCLLDTPGGRILARITGRPGLRHALDELTDSAIADVASGAVPPIYQSGVRYRREPGRGRIEHWNRPSRVLSVGYGDCEDFAAWRAAELCVEGIPARAVLVPARGRGWVGFHALTKVDAGVLGPKALYEDPSLCLGMGERVMKPRWRLQRRNGGYLAQLIVPIDVARPGVPAPCIAVEGTGESKGLALIDACDRLDVGLCGAGYYGVGQLEAITVDAATPYLEKAWDEVKSWIVGTHYDAFMDYVKRVAVANAGVTPVSAGSRDEQIIGTLIKVLAAGWIPIYCSDSEGTRNDINREFSNLGWTGGKPWWHRYWAGVDKGYTHWYGISFPLDEAPADLVGESRTRYQADPEGAMKATIAYITDAKSYQENYAPDDAHRISWREKAIRSIPVVEAVPTALTDEETPAETRMRQPLPAETQRGITTLRDAATLAVENQWDALRFLSEAIDREGRSSSFSRLVRALTSRW